jgi:hypothetical protein
MQEEFLVHTREGPALPALRDVGRADRRLWTLDLLLPELPGAIAAQTPPAPSGSSAIVDRLWPERR